MILRAAELLTRFFPLVLVLLAVLAFFTPAESRHLAPAVPAYIGIVMLAMGLTMGPEDFRGVFAAPRKVFLGVVLRYALMPLVALGVAKILHLGPALATGFILIGCCPSAVASNVMTFLSRGNTALSVTISTCNTIVAPLLTPLLFLFFAGAYIKVDAVGMFVSIAKIVLLPVVAGIVIRLWAGKRISNVIPYLPAVSALALILIVMSGVALSAGQMEKVGLIAFVGVVLHNGIGLAAGFLAARMLFRFPQPDAQAVAFEVGLENTGLAIALAIGHLDPAATIPAAIFGAWHNVSGSIIARYWASRRDREAAPLSSRRRKDPCMSHAVRANLGEAGPCERT